MRIIKEFFQWRRSLDSHSIDILPAMQRQLDAFDYSTAQVLYDKTLDKLWKEMLKGEVSAEYVLWAKFALTHFKQHFKNNNNK